MLVFACTKISSSKLRGYLVIKGDVGIFPYQVVLVKTFLAFSLHKQVLHQNVANFVCFLVCLKLVFLLSV